MPQNFKKNNNSFYNIFSWPYLPAHMIIGVLTFSSLISNLLGQAPLKWILVCSGIWLIYIILLFITEKIQKHNLKNILQSMITIVFIFGLYRLLADLAFEVIPWNGDKLISSIDKFIFFGHSPVVYLSRFATPEIVELFSIAYGIFIPYLYFSIFLCLLGRPEDEKKIFITALTITYAISFLGYLFVPAKGPIVFMENEFSSPLSGGYFLGLVVDAINNAGGPHGAFPSLHIGASWVICFFDIRRGQLRGLLYIPLVLCIFLATMLLRYHYFIDLFAGFIIATFAVLISERIHEISFLKRPLIVIFFHFITRFYFSNIQVNRLYNFPKEMPVILISNHVNAFIDPFVIAVATGRPLKITAKASLWKNPLIRMAASLFGVIPISRSEDSKNKKYQLKNVSSFQTCFEGLDQNETICIFPEGKSHSESEMLPFKTGVARMALEYAQSSEKGNQVCILPVGLFYNCKSRFGSRAFVEIGQPIILSEWIKRNETEDYRLLTKNLEEKIGDLTPQAKTRKDLSLLIWLSEIYQRFKIEPVSVDYIYKFPENFIKVTQYLINNYYRLKHNPEIKRLKEDAELFKSELDKSGIRAEEVFLPMHFWKAVFFMFRELEILLLGSLLCTAGLILNIFPLTILIILVRFMSSDEDHWATNYIFYGIILMLFWCVGIALFSIFYSPWLLFLIPVSIFCGYFGSQYIQRLIRTLKRLKTFMRFLIQPWQQKQLIEKQTHIVNMLIEIEKKHI